MEKLTQLLSIVILAALMTGCATQKPSAKMESMQLNTKALHEQALQALESQNFILKADDKFFLPDGTTKFSPNGYISLQNGKVDIKFHPDFSPGGVLPWTVTNIETHIVNISKTKTQKNGDILFEIHMKGVQEWRFDKFLITLYNNSNKCFVQTFKGVEEENTVSFYGEIFSL